MGLRREIYYAARSLRATPLFTVASVAILALGIGATTAVFSVVNGLLLKPLPVQEPDRLVRIWKNDVERGFDHVPLTYPEYERWAERATRFDAVAALWSWGPNEAIWDVDGEARRLLVEQVSANFFDVLGVRPAYGRSFVEADEDRTAVPPILLSFDAFRSRFASDPAIVGQTVSIRFGERERFEVIGVLPPAFRLGSSADVYVPTLAIDRDWHMEMGCECDLIARLRPGVGAAEARAELQAIHDRDAAEDPSDIYRPLEVVMTPLLDTIVGSAGKASVFLFGAVSLLLALATVNLAGLFLTRTAKRQRELAVRAAIGAGRDALVRPVVAESLLIAGFGLLGGWLVARWGVELLLVFGRNDLPRTDQVELDGFVLGFSAVLALVSTLGFGVWPAVRASRLDLVQSLRGKTVGLVNTRLVGRLVVVEIAIAFVLLAASSLLVRSLAATEGIDPGFRTERLLDVAIRLPEPKYPEVADRFEFHRRLREDVEALPGVLGATPSLFRPGGGTRGISGALRFEGQTEEEAKRNAMAQLEWVAPNFFQVMGIPILRGRSFSETDREGAEPVAIVNETMAKAYWPGEDPVGKWAEGFSRRFRIVGVAADTRFRELRRPWQSVYFSIEQNVFLGQATGASFLVPKHLVVQTASDPELALPSILNRIRTLDAEIPLDDVTTFEALIEHELARPRFHAFLSSVFSLVGLVLAATGIYGVIASFVAERLPELGLRLALGATPEGLRRFILARGLEISLGGLALGFALALPSLGLAESLLFGVPPRDATSFAAVSLVLAVVSFAAIYLPARRAGRTDPMTLLREE